LPPQNIIFIYAIKLYMIININSKGNLSVKLSRKEYVELNIQYQPIYTTTQVWGQ